MPEDQQEDATLTPEEIRKRYGAATLEEALELWGDGQPVWTMTMGGLGPGYEQALQVVAWEAARRWKDADELDHDEEWPDEGPFSREAMDDVIDELGVGGVGGLSGAQARAARWLAYRMVVEDYGPLMARVAERDKDRLTQVSRRFPSVEYEGEEEDDE